MESSATTPGSDEQRLAELGYKQSLNRAWSGFSNFAISFTIISILAGCFTTYGQAWNNGGPIAISIGWPLISIPILIIGFCMSELVSTYPTAGGIYWWAGRLWGERIVHLFAGQRERQRRRGQKFIERVNRWGRWFTWPAVIISPFLPIPNAIIYAVAGWTGMSWVTFLILDIIGTLSWAGMLAGLGYALGQHAVSVAQTVSKYGLWVSIGIVVLVIAGQMRGVRSQR